jgi:Kef-type K+ transport system membrane component KefB
MPNSDGRRLRYTACALALVLTVGTAHAAGSPDPVAPVLLAIATMLGAAKLGSHVVSFAHQPPVLGELLAGVVLGNLALVGIHVAGGLAQDPTIDILARLGVVILLFEVGLESTVREMMDVGWPSFFVAVLGVVAPFALGFAAGQAFVPGPGIALSLFLGATLTATSIGITARVLKDLGRSRSQEARIVLGAAVIDDVLGLIILSVVTGMVSAADGGGVSAGSIGIIVGKAVGFLMGALMIGVLASPRLFAWAARIEGEGVLLASALIFAFLLSYGASVVGLAPIIGAYAAGLILEPVHFQKFADRGEQGLEVLVKPVATLLAPLFFVSMGMHVDLRAFTRPEVLLLAGLLTAAAILGKLACALAVPRGLNRMAIAFGMMPRGEVGLIFAAAGRALTVAGKPLFDESVFSAIVVMVVATTLLAPPSLKWALRKSPDPSGSSERSPR